MAMENWYLDVLRRGIEPSNEANTSRYVHEVLRHCLRWPMEAIVPQSSRRGYIDYLLAFRHPSASLRIEVKRYNSTLRENQIRKYLVHPGRRTEEFHVGILTNLREWEIYVAGPKIRSLAGSPLVRVGLIPIKGRADIGYLDDLIGYRSQGGLRGLRSALGESPEVLHRLLTKDRAVLRAVRFYLDVLRERRVPEAHVPHYERLGSYITSLLAGKPLSGFPLRKAYLRQALGSVNVATAANDRLVSVFGSRQRVHQVKRAIRYLVRERE